MSIFKQFTHAENILIRMNVLYKESDYEFTDLINVVEIKVILLKWQTMVSINKYCTENNLAYYICAEGNKVILVITTKHN